MLAFKNLPIFISMLGLVTSQTLKYCRLEGDPHIKQFHEVGRSMPPNKDCLAEGPLTVVSNSYLTLTMEVHRLVMVELLFTFRAQPGTPSFCTISSYNSQLNIPTSCAAGGVFANVTFYKNFYVISVSNPSQNIRTTLTHYPSSNPAYYDMHVWMDASKVANSIGVCAVAGCTGRLPGKRSVRSIQSAINNVTAVSNATAQQICNTYIDSYLNSLSRIPADRDAHYNSTIESCREMCVYDVTTLGPTLATGYLSTLMIEEITTGLTNISDIDTAITAQMPQAVVNLDLSLNQSIQVVAQILNITLTETMANTTQTTSTTATSLITNQTSSVPQTTTLISSAVTVTSLKFYTVALLISSPFIAFIG